VELVGLVQRKGRLEAILFLAASQQTAVVVEAQIAILYRMASLAVLEVGLELLRQLLLERALSGLVRLAKATMAALP
jgi:hypothetical protein